MNTTSPAPLFGTLRFGFGETRLGLALAAVSERGVAAILLGDDKPRLRRELARAFPDAALTEDEGELAGTLASVEALQRAHGGVLGEHPGSVLGFLAGDGPLAR